MGERRTTRPTTKIKGTANGHAARHQATLADGGFDVRLQMLPALTQREEEDFEQGLTRYLRDRDLLGEGTPLAMTISGVGRELSTTDRVDMIVWLMQAAPVAAVWISQPTGDDDIQDTIDGAGRLRACRSDLAVPLVLQLYRLGRIGPEIVAQVLTP